jgi:formyl-CoA transferase
VVIDPDATDAATVVAALARSCEAVIHSDESAWSSLIDLEAVVADGIPVIEVRGFAPGGPYADYLAPEIVTTALGGLLFISGDAALPPCAPPEPLGQYFASVWAALATVSAIWAKRQHGTPATFGVSTHESLATLEHLIRAAAMDGEPIVRNGSQHKSVAPANVFPTQDGHVYIYVSRNHWPAFLGAWDPHPAEFDDPKYVPNSARRAVAERLNAAVSAWTGERRTADVVDVLQGAGVPCLAVNRPSDFIADRQVVARELFSTATHSHLGTFEQMRFPVLIDGIRPAPSIPPLLGQDTTAVLATLAEGAKP